MIGLIKPRYVILSICLLLFMLFVLLIGKTNNIISNEEVSQTEVVAKVLFVENEEVIQTGISAIGYQRLTVKILNGKNKNEELKATNQLIGKKDIDNFYKIGDTVLVAMLLDDEQHILDAKVIERFRLPSLLFLFLLFVFLLIAFAKAIGFRALMSFLVSILVIWFYLIQNLLKGQNPIICVTITVMFLSSIIIFSVAGFSKKSVTAFCGTFIGLIVTLLLTLLYGKFLNLSGFTQPFAGTLIINGHFNLNMQQIFYAAIILGASGAAMDVSMDIAASIEEIHTKLPHLSYSNLLVSGLNVGKSVMGTMTTTLLLAYSGSYLTLIMVFASKGTPLLRMINLKMVTAELVRILIGSISLVIVAPITAVIAAGIYTIHWKEIIVLQSFHRSN